MLVSKKWRHRERREGTQLEGRQSLVKWAGMTHMFILDNTLCALILESYLILSKDLTLNVLLFEYNLYSFFFFFVAKNLKENL